MLTVRTTIPNGPASSVARLACLLFGDFLPSARQVETVADIATPATAPYAASTIAIITFHLDARRESRDQVINTPNWPTEEGYHMSVNSRPWTQQIDTWLACRVERLCD